ncbi:MAG: MATE family efflux transporter [Erysipelotrichaceae bacterium]
MENKLGTMNMKKLVVEMSLPLMASLLMQSLYNIVDSIFVAKLSKDALTATSLAFPMQLMMIATGVGTAVGVNALLSRSIGAREHERTNNIAVTGIILSLLSSVIFTVIGLFFSGSFIGLFSNDLEISLMAKEYLSICLVFCQGSLVATMYQRFLQSEGNSFYSMVSLMSGAIVNIILDPIMIFAMNMGITGAAVATVTGQYVAAITGIILNYKFNKSVHPKLSIYHFETDIVAGIYRVGLPTIVTQAIGSLMVSGVNALLIGYSDSTVAFFGVYYKLQSFLFMPMNGLGQGLIPIVGYNYGARKYERIKEAFRFALPVGCVIALIMAVIFMVFPKELLSLFNADSQMLNIGVNALRIMSVSFVFASVTIILGYGLSGLGNGVINMVSAFIRQLLIPLVLIYVIGKVFGLDYIWYSFVISEFVALIYSSVSSLRYSKKKGIEII